MPIRYLLPTHLQKSTVISTEIPLHLQHLKLPFNLLTVRYESGEWGEILSQELAFDGQRYIEQYYLFRVDTVLDIYVEDAVIVLLGMIQGSIKLLKERGGLILLSKRRSMHYIPTETKFTLKLTGGKRYRTVAIFPKHNVILKMQSDYPPLKRLLDAYANKNADLLTLPSTVLSSEDRNELVKTRNGTLSQQARFRYYNNRMNEFLVDYLEGVNRAGDNPDKAERLMEQIHQLILRLEHHPEKSFNIQLLAQQVGISLRYLERFFQEIKQSSVISYIIKLRVEKSKELLVTTNKTVGEISILIGYEDQSYFVRVFKKTTGITPTMYRSAERNKRNDK